MKFNTMQKVELTKAEEQIMQVLWKLEKGFVKDIIPHLPDPKPAYSTVSTIIRILVDKGVVSYKAYGKTHEYYPLVSKEIYSRQRIKDLMLAFFDGSPRQLLSFLAKKEDVSLQDFEEVVKTIKKGTDDE